MAPEAFPSLGADLQTCSCPQIWVVWKGESTPHPQLRQKVVTRGGVCVVPSVLHSPGCDLALKTVSLAHVTRPHPCGREGEGRLGAPAPHRALAHSDAQASKQGLQGPAGARAEESQEGWGGRQGALTPQAPSAHSLVQSGVSHGQQLWSAGLPSAQGAEHAVAEQGEGPGLQGLLPSCPQEAFQQEVKAQNGAVFISHQQEVLNAPQGLPCRAQNGRGGRGRLGQWCSLQDSGSCPPHPSHQDEIGGK